MEASAKAAQICGFQMGICPKESIPFSVEDLPKAEKFIINVVLHGGF